MPPKFRNPRNLTIALPESKHHHSTSAPSPLPLPPANAGPALSPPSPSPPFSQRPHSEPSTCDSFRRKRRVPPNLTVRTDHECVSRTAAMALPPTPTRTVSRKQQTSSNASSDDGSIRSCMIDADKDEDVWGGSGNSSSVSGSASNSTGNTSDGNSELQDEYDEYDQHDFNINNNDMGNGKGNGGLDREVPQTVDSGYGDGPIQIYDAGLWLYAEPTRDVASQFDVVINVAKEVTNPFDLANDTDSSSSTSSRKRPEYLHVRWGHSTAIIQNLPALCQLIHSRLSQKKRVLVHCQYGVSRSASLVVAYGLYRQRALRQRVSDFHEMYDSVKRRSPHVGPNMHLIYELMEFRKNAASGCYDGSQHIPQAWFWRDTRDTEGDEDKENMPQSQSPPQALKSPSPPTRLKSPNKSSSSSAPLQEQNNRYSTIASNREMQLYPSIPRTPTDLHSPAGGIFNTPALFSLLTSKFCA